MTLGLRGLPQEPVHTPARRYTSREVRNCRGTRQDENGDVQMTAIQRTISPVDNSVYVERELASAEQIDRALDAAVRAQRAWQTVPVAERAALCLKMVEAFVGRADEIGEASMQGGNDALCVIDAERRLRDISHRRARGNVERVDLFLVLDEVNAAGNLPHGGLDFRVAGMAD